MQDGSRGRGGGDGRSRGAFDDERGELEPRRRSAGRSPREAAVDDYGRDIFDRAADRSPPSRRKVAVTRRDAMREDAGDGAWGDAPPFDDYEAADAGAGDLGRDDYDLDHHGGGALSRRGRADRASARDEIGDIEIVDDTDEEDAGRGDDAAIGLAARNSVARDSFSRSGAGRGGAGSDSAGARRGFRRRRSADEVETVDARGDEGFDADGFGSDDLGRDDMADLDDDVFAEARPRPAARRGTLARAPSKDGGEAAPRPSAGIVWAGVFASVLWVVGVGAFSLGYFGVSVQSVGALSAGVSNLAIHLKLMTAAAMVAPLGIVWVTVSAGRRAEALATAARQMRGPAAASAMGDAASPATLQDEADRTVRALGAVESGLRAAEERASKAREQLETERRALASLIEDFEADAGRIVEAFSRASGSDGHPAIDALASAVAERLSPDASARPAPSTRVRADGPAPKAERAVAVRDPSEDEPRPRRAAARGYGADARQDAPSSARRGWRADDDGGLDAPLEDPEPLEPYETPRFDDEYEADFDGEPDGEFDGGRSARDRRASADRDYDAPRRGSEDLDDGYDDAFDEDAVPPRDRSDRRRDLSSRAGRGGAQDRSSQERSSHERSAGERGRQDRGVDRGVDRDAADRQTFDRPSLDEGSGSRRRTGRAVAAPIDEPTVRNPLDDRADAEADAPAAGGASDDFDWSKFVRAANFPDSEDDRETLDALYAVLADAEAAALLQSAEDALSSLADIGLYMEDLKPEHAPVESWRAFIVNGDQREATDLGGVRDAHALQDVASALDDNPSFGEIGARFIERYEAMLERMFSDAPDPGMAVELADTRTGRAYMLVGRASGRFE